MSVAVFSSTPPLRRTFFVNSSTQLTHRSSRRRRSHLSLIARARLRFGLVSSLQDRKQKETIGEIAVGQTIEVAGVLELAGYLITTQRIVGQTVHGIPMKRFIVRQIEQFAHASFAGRKVVSPTWSVASAKLYF